MGENRLQRSGCLLGTAAVSGVCLESLLIPAFLQRASLDLPSLLSSSQKPRVGRAVFLREHGQPSNACRKVGLRSQVSLIRDQHTNPGVSIVVPPNVFRKWMEPGGVLAQRGLCLGTRDPIGQVDQKNVASAVAAPPPRVGFIFFHSSSPVYFLENYLSSPLHLGILCVGG